MVVIAVVIPFQTWSERGVLFGIVAALTFTPVFLGNAVPAVQRALAHVPSALIFAGMVFVLLGTWTSLSVVTCTLSAVAAAIALAVLSRRSGTP